MRAQSTKLRGASKMCVLYISTFFEIKKKYFSITRGAKESAFCFTNLKFTSLFVQMHVTLATLFFFTPIGRFIHSNTPSTLPDRHFTVWAKRTPAKALRERHSPSSPPFLLIISRQKSPPLKSHFLFILFFFLLFTLFYILFHVKYL